MTSNTKRSRVNEIDVVSVVTMSNNQSLSLLSADKIGSCDDLATEIMLRLPVTSLLRFKSVSKHWYSIISNPTFKKLIQNRSPDPPTGLYAMTKTNTRDHYFIPFDLENQSKAPNLTLNFDPDDRGTTYIVHSCNGLMLCCCQYWNEHYKAFMVSNRYVYNPTINQFTTLPKHEIFNSNYRCGMTLAFDPSKSSYYKIVSLCNSRMDHYSIGIYSSQTRTWKASCRCNWEYDCYSHVNDTPGVYWNNAVHWLLISCSFWYINLSEDIIRKIPTSFRFVSTNNMFESRDHLLVVERDYDIRSKIKIHELKRDYSGWFVKYHVDLNQLGQLFPEAVNFDSVFIPGFRVVSVVLGETEDESFFVLEIAGVVVRFNMVAKTFYKLHNFVDSYIYDTSLVYFQFPYSRQFIPSLNCV